MWNFVRKFGLKDKLSSERFPKLSLESEYKLRTFAREFLKIESPLSKFRNFEKVWEESLKIEISADDVHFSIFWEFFVEKYIFNILLKARVFFSVLSYFFLDWDKNCQLQLFTNIFNSFHFWKCPQKKLKNEIFFDVFFPN